MPILPRTQRELTLESFAAYNELKKEYSEEEFEVKCAKTMISVMEVRYDSNHPDGISLLEAALVLMIPAPGEDPETTAHLRKCILAAMVWYQKDQENLGKSVKP